VALGVSRRTDETPVDNSSQGTTTNSHPGDDVGDESVESASGDAHI
jgi:hypothetical protein